MQQWKSACIITIMMLCAVIRVSAQESYTERAQKYVALYKEWAIEEQRRTGVPAAITLAQGIHETGGGQSELAENANNHFGIKCKKEWTGDTYSYTDDAPNECFRKYDNVLSSYRDHSDYLAGSPRYAALFKLDIKDYKGWAAGLKRCGYATNPKYAQILIKIVEDYGLNDFTVAALEPATEKPFQQQLEPAQKQPVVRTAGVQKEVVPVQDAPVTASIEDTPPAPKKTKMQVSYGQTVSELKANKQPQQAAEQPAATTEYGVITRVNDLKAFYAKKGSMLLNESIKYDIRYAKLLELNDLPDAPLEADMYIYLEKKHTTGDNATHIVEEGETLLQIAQKQGIQLKYLKAYNKIGGNEEPMPGATLQLLDYATVKPATRPKATAPKTMLASNNALKKVPASGEDAFIAKDDLGKPKRIAPTKETIAGIQGKNASAEQPVFMMIRPVNKADVPAIDIPEVEEEPVAIVQEPTAVETVPVVQEVVAKNDNSSEPVTDKTLTTNAPVETTPGPANPEPVTNTAVGNDVASSNAAEEKEEVVNVADETAVEEMIKQAHEEAGKDAEDEFSKLKSKLDKVVYASNKAAEDNDALRKEAKAIQKDVKSGKASEYYTVKKGDTAFSIAKKHNISMSQLREWNKLDFQEIKAGQQLRVK